MFKEIIGIFGIVVILFIILILILTGLVFTAQRKACDVWRDQTGRNTKFVSDFPWYCDCLTETESGWISATHLYQQETPNLK